MVARLQAGLEVNNAQSFYEGRGRRDEIRDLSCSALTHCVDNLLELGCCHA